MRKETPYITQNASNIYAAQWNNFAANSLLRYTLRQLGQVLLCFYGSYTVVKFFCVLICLLLQIYVVTTTHHHYSLHFKCTICCKLPSHVKRGDNLCINYHFIDSALRGRIKLQFFLKDLMGRTTLKIGHHQQQKKCFFLIIIICISLVCCCIQSNPLQS